MICREMPATWDATFRPGFYARWGRENCVISARTRRAEYPDFEQCLSVKAVWSGSEDYYVDGRRVRVDEDTFLILNERRIYASRIHAPRPVHSFSIFFRPHMAADVLAALTRPDEALLDDPAARPAAAVEFAEHVRRHDARVTPLLRIVSRAVELGAADEVWLEEQLVFLLERLLALHRADLARVARVPSSRPRTRRELYRRIGLGLDFIHANSAAPIDLAAIAAAAHLSQYHFLRVFKAAIGETPAAYLRRCRAQAAARMLARGDCTMQEVADRAGYGSRTTLYREALRLLGASPAALRARAAR